MRILITNDDGIEAAGLEALATGIITHAERQGVDVNEIFVVAPEKEQSTCAHSLTLHKPLRRKTLANGWIAINGTPADCVSLAVVKLVPQPIDMVISGINHGANLGNDIVNSGTVSGAMQGLQMGIPSMAVSLATEHGDNSQRDFTAAVVATARVMQLIKEHGMSKEVLINVNVPVTASSDRPLEYRLTRMGRKTYAFSFFERQDPKGRTYYWHASHPTNQREADDTDVAAVADGFVSVTPIYLDCTNDTYLKEMQEWQF